ncbi:hypothetical protein PRECH8_00980 [Insulibacter thermoxylanivorax]|uniref:Copper transport outer membrane protein, MctB n=1 Tax=Insulibacter thermoxylanivorax TaxID=2749268 RepID=A0A916VE30_9BACL|nr:copper transporter [Insulibacter thermoxylanivorax]GFR36802.1 hypothetical protein PRECH8_00980 [Insulibacter thermoxylanivorax]
MLSARYHIATIIAIFLSLGVGIVIGGTLGQKWAVQAENSIVEMLTNRYEMMLAENQAMKKQLGSLELFLKTVSPASQSKLVWWYRTPHPHEDLLVMVLNAAGVEWVEKQITEEIRPALKLGERQPDYVLVTDPAVKQLIEEQLLQAFAGSAEGSPQLIDATEHAAQLTDPNKIVEFMLYMKQLVEEEAYAAAQSRYLSDHPGME